ncbi:hypothetical protein Zmor_019581 [Zophobas morio]|uniref:Uncharacterized protein n=1 Tax=Zophobas morio TaxID=2755281 RepID=A0AA38I286_9CUCU|nr:hypothetical protein Zmor_019581 [Zophobas morio]
MEVFAEETGSDKAVLTYRLPKQPQTTCPPLQSPHWLICVFTLGAIRFALFRSRAIRECQRDFGRRYRGIFRFFVSLSGDLSILIDLVAILGRGG